MRFPFILRSDHEEAMKLAELNFRTYQDTIQSLKDQLTQKEAEIDSLIIQLVGPERHPAPRDKKEEKKWESKPIFGRSGWRARAGLASRQTIPPVKDSAKALEEKVLREGGIV
jgi:hypothetical protein